MNRISLQDNAMSAIIKMADGNPGAINAMMELLTNAPRIDPNECFGGLGCILLLDSYGIYGTDIYVLYSDICDRNIAKLIAVLRASQTNMFDGKLLQKACSRQDYSGRKFVPVGELYNEVKERWPLFDVEDTGR